MIKNPKVRLVKSKKGLILFPEDDATTGALRRTSQHRETGLRKPRIIIKYVDSLLESDVITWALANQNPDLRLSESDTGKVMPLFKLGPRDGHFVHWVCEVHPDTLAKLEGKSAYLGLTKCIIKIYTQVTQCYNCQGYGHTAVTCKADKPTCRHCAQAHESRSCSLKDAQPKCANCKGKHAASSKNCKARERAALTMTRRTDFAISSNEQCSTK